MPAVRLLLDTHVFLWWRADDKRLRPTVRKAIAEAEIVFVSAASAWEAAIKVALGRLRIPDTLEAGVIESGFEKLPINFTHAEDAAQLPPHHNDPFDRMLIAQAAAEGLTLVTHDRRLQPYGIDIMWT
jgi:PIN domain nuclease of toxin-antitoxin system